jgi:hypothetical protein
VAGLVLLLGAASFVTRKHARYRKVLAAGLAFIGSVGIIWGLLHIGDPTVIVRRQGYLVPEQPGFAAIGLG